MCYDEIGLYAQYIDTIVILIVNKIERRGSTWENKIHYNPSWFVLLKIDYELKLQMIIFVIHNC